MKNDRDIKFLRHFCDIASYDINIYCEFVDQVLLFQLLLDIIIDSAEILITVPETEEKSSKYHYYNI